ncbi:ATP-dependent DNA helicase RecG [Haploplasma axanthum]|nr:ATP-dependent DNA helicase RecG [Haploplasma axanthum]
MIVKLEKVKGVGEKLKKVFRQNGIWSTYDLARFFPSSYDEFELTTLDSSKHNEVVTIKGIVISDLEKNIYSRVDMITFDLETNKTVVKVIAFNQKFLMNSLKKTDDIYIKGKYDFYKKKIIVNKIMKENSFESIKPKYKIDGMSDTIISKILFNIFEENQVEIYENMPKTILTKYKLLDRYEAYKKLHFPNNNNEIELAKRRIKFEEAYFFQKEFVNKINKRITREKRKYDLQKVKSFIEKIPYQLTNDQKQAVNDVFGDFKKSEVGYRLIQGDVGSGKTIVANIAMYGVVTAGFQTVLMAPTELLAKQHYEGFKRLLNDGLRIELLTSDSKNKEEIKNSIKDGNIKIIIGTHALIQDDVEFNNLGLIVIDEQHKFGVETRNQLIKKSIDADLIYLTATPIPRTLAISLFGDADISVIKEKPQKRKKIITKAITDKDLTIVFDEIQKTLERNEKVYVVVPAIESEHAKYNIQNVYELLLGKFSDKEIFITHGKNKKDEQEKAILNFMNSKRGILIATTMIEVGIDIPKTTLMVIFSANFFGLSQLHQLRGRVGRGHLESKCYLISTGDIEERLEIIEKEDDGFILSDYDLKLRGPGDLLGVIQTGFNDFKFLDFINDYEILKMMREELLKTKNKL